MCQFVALTPEAFRRASRAERASGVGAIVAQRWQSLHALPPRGCWLVLERARSPGNLGTSLRSSSAFGGAGVILVGNEVDPFDPRTVRASMGALFGQRLVRTDLAALHGWANHQVRIPMHHTVDSLDLAVAGSMLLYEATSQRQRQVQLLLQVDPRFTKM